MIEQRIEALDDATACRVLRAAAGPLARSGESETALSPALRHALTEQFGAPPAGGAASEGELARQALLLLAQEPQRRAAIAAMLDGPAPEPLGVGTAVAALGRTLLLLKP